MKQIKTKALGKEFQGISRIPRVAYQLKISLREITPPIWRRIIVPSDIRLGKLHSILQDVMGWTDSHLHEFIFGAEHFGVKGPDSPDVKSELRIDLESIAPIEGGTFTYLYDFGDGWEHNVEVERIGPWQSNQRGSYCLEGARACPPEDVGGVGGYEDLVKSMRGPDSEERQEFVQWLGQEYDPEVFRLMEVNDSLRLRG